MCWNVFDFPKALSWNILSHFSYFYKCWRHFGEPFCTEFHSSPFAIHNSYHLNFTIYTYLLTPWCRVVEKLTVLQLVKKFPAFHGTRMFITALTSVRHLSLSWTSPIQSIYPHPTSWRCVLILTTHLRVHLPSGLFPSGFPTKTLYTPISSTKEHKIWNACFLTEHNVFKTFLLK